MSAIAVTGASGHLGRLIVEDLLAHDVAPGDVVAGGRRTERLEDLAAAGVRTAHLDYDDPASLTAALTDVDTVMLVSGDAVGERVRQHRAVLDAAVSAGARRIVYTSAPHADTSPLVLAPEHKATEQLIRESGLAFTVLRNNWYTENYLSALEQARRTGEILSSTGGGRVASAPRADFAAAASVVLRTGGHDGATYELAGDDPWTHDELAAAMSQVLGTPVRHRAVDPDEHLAALTGAGLDEGTAGFVVALDADIRAGLLAGGEHDLSRLLGRPTTPLVDALRAAAEAP